MAARESLEHYRLRNQGNLPSVVDPIQVMLIYALLTSHTRSRRYTGSELTQFPPDKEYIQVSRGRYELRLIRRRLQTRRHRQAWQLALAPLTSSDPGAQTQGTATVSCRTLRQASPAPAAALLRGAGYVRLPSTAAAPRPQPFRMAASVQAAYRGSSCCAA